MLYDVERKAAEKMRGDAHRQAALDIEQAIAKLGDPAANPALGRSIIELYWGASFHWLAYGCDRKHGKHKETHDKLGKFLRDIGEPAMAARWDALDNDRRGGWYGHHASIMDVADAHDGWEGIRLWATS